MPSIRVAIAGATGYAGQELIRLLLQHPNVQLTCLAASAKWERPIPASEVFPRFAGHPDLLDRSVESLHPVRLAEQSDAVFLALPHGTAMELAPALLQSGKKVIDLSGDFRLSNAADYPRWYKFQHAHPELLNREHVVYGLTEFHREAIRQASLVANPGCYATSILLACIPLFKENLVGDGGFIVDAKSGLSGAGRKADESLLFTEMTENLRTYKVNDHQHMPEVLQEIEHLTGRRTRMVFVPQVIPVSRGLVSMVYLRTGASREKIGKAFETWYPPQQTPFVRIRPGSLPQLTDVVGTNYCDIGFVYDATSECLIVASTLDNLTKGAAGQAVQNFNVMYGF
ncbi:MAG: N-acetyl-gamma-glutamyl-phosphate reductase, partial [Candidatus Omnitrophica bacterium]|nr:N-acetyl-gamma-glutamyl-phosphate reductase [Candidatus Omnitrophota bacterium]